MLLFIPSSLSGNPSRLDEHDGAVVGSEGGAEAAGEAPRQDGAAEQAARPSGKLIWITDPLHLMFTHLKIGMWL